ncbi:hypothetical protein [Paenibacillus mucilaginosus]|uniref:hypothetical protein n=1 Tax=Paenibacillus mucilaginosus TaxID=61624 RepID=UPI003D1BC3D5
MADGLHSPTTTKSKGDIKNMVNFVSVVQGIASVGKGIGFGIVAIGALPFMLVKSMQ